MKTTKILLLAVLLSWSHTAAAQVTPFIFGPVTFRLTATHRVDPTITVRTNSVITVTNVVGGVEVIRKLTVSRKSVPTNSVIDNAALLKLLENSFNTTFPAGAQLYGTGFRFVVMNVTGTNEVLDVSSVLAGSCPWYVIGENGRIIITESPAAGVLDNEISKQRGTWDTEIKYDDSAMSTKDGSHTVFSMRGPMSTTLVFNAPNTSARFSCNGFGSGFIENDIFVVKGTMTGPLRHAIQSSP